MQIIQNTTSFRIPKKTAVAIGKFDGIHKGHRLLLAEIIKAKDKGLCAAVFTFDPVPAVFFGRQDVKELTTLQEKRECFSKMGIDYLVEYPLNELSASVKPEEYVERFLLDQMQASLVVAGADITFGKKGAGNAALLQDIACRNACNVKILDKLQYQGRDISSTFVRELVEQGEMEKAAKLIGEPFFLSGTVVHGNEIGRTIGFPTINVIPPSNKLLPPNGVYFSKVSVDGKVYNGITNIGNKPTVGEGYQKGAETFLYDFNRDLYDRQVKIELLHFVRRECKFGDFAELKDAIADNVLQGKVYFGIES